MGGEVGLVGRDFDSPDNRYHYFKTKELIFYETHCRIFVINFQKKANKKSLIRVYPLV